LYYHFIEWLHRRAVFEENEKILNNQKTEGAGRFSLEDLESLYVNKTNKRLPIIPIAPYIYMYQSGLKSFKPEKYEQKKVKIKEKYEKKILKYAERQKKLRSFGIKWGEKLTSRTKT